MRETPNLLLKLPDTTDYVLVEDLNENFTTIDTEIAKITDEETGVEAKLNKHSEEDAHIGFNHRAGVGLNNVQSVASDAPHVINFNAVLFNNGHMVIDGDSTRITCTKEGVYLLSANVVWDSSNAGSRQIFLRVNGTAIYGDKIVNSIGVTYSSIAGVVKLYLDDYVEVVVVQDSGNALGISGYEGCPILSATRVG